MAEELHQEDIAQGQGPPELIIKLALQYLTWKDEYLFSDKSLLTSVGVVCKKWKELLETDEVGRPLCLNLLKSYDDLVVTRNRNGRAYAEEQGRDFEDEIFFSKTHELLAKLMKSGPPQGRSYKELFVLSERMGRRMDDHMLHGPDVQTPHDRDTRSLREASIQEYRWITRPTIEKLRDVFDNHDDNTGERTRHVAEMKKRLLHHARETDRRLLLRKGKLQLEKEELAEDVGRTMLMLAASNDLGKQIFVPSSLLASVSLGDVIEGLETIKGGEIAVQMSLQVNRTPSGMKRKFTCLPGKKKLLGTRIDELSWPENPVDSINFLIRKFLPQKGEVEWDDYDDDYDGTEEARERIWNDVVNKFWLEAVEPVRQLLVTVYNDEVASRFKNYLPVDTSTQEVPLETLKQIFELPYEYFRKKIADQIWRDIDPSLCEQIFDIYHRQAEAFSDAIQEEYVNVYSETSSHEHNAKVLLDIFLEVPPRQDDNPSIPPGSLTAEACDTFVERMEEAMDRWNELIDQAKTDYAVLWDPQTMNELDSFDLMFDQLHSHYRRGRTPTLEFCVPQMVTEFLYWKLSSAQKIPKSWEFEKELKNLYDDYIVSNNGVWSVELESRGMRLVQDFRTLTSHIYTRDHAMFALVPLLPHLSKRDCRRLVYALFIQQEDDRNSQSKWYYARCTFSSMNYRHLGTSRFFKKIPCALGDDTASDLLLLCKWHHEKNFFTDIYNNYEVWGYVFGVPLPDNIISSMGEFLVESLYQGNITDVNTAKISNVRRVMLVLERFCYETPKSAHIVWDYMREAIHNAIAVVEELPEIEIQPDQHSVWMDVIALLVVSCIEMRAKRLLSDLRRLYHGTPFTLLPGNFVSFKTLVERVKQEEPLIINDTLQYHQLYHLIE